jgi:hypothetical protein
MGTGAQNGAQLLAKHFGLGQAPANGAQTERRIERPVMPRLVY